MAKVQFLGPIQKDTMEVDIESLQELKAILGKDEELKEWLEISSIAINDNLVCSLDTKVKQDDTISLLPPVCGG